MTAGGSVSPMACSNWLCQDPDRPSACSTLSTARSRAHSLFVPDTPTEPGGKLVEIRVRGVADVSLNDVFPRFRENGGELLAQLENVPSAIWLPSRRTLSTNRIADLAVIVVLVMGTALWLLQNRTRRVTVAMNPKP